MGSPGHSISIGCLQPRMRGRQGSEPRGDETPSEAAGTLLLVGNPNVGKSVLFKALTRRYVTVSNFPGTTVEIVKAQAKLLEANFKNPG